MMCDRDMLLLISTYADGEATPEEAARAEEHLAHCADCRTRVEQWQGHRQLFTWSYTRELPDICDADTWMSTARKGGSPSMEQPVPPTEGLEHTGKPLPYRTLRWVAAAAAVLLLAVMSMQFFHSHPFLLVGHEVVANDNSRPAQVGMQVTLEVGPHSQIRRVNKQTIRLEKGWVTATVRDKASITIETPRMTVTDRGTRFQVGIGAKADYVTVDEGAVDVTAGNNLQRTVNADEALLVSDTGDPTLIALSPARPGIETGLPLRAYHPAFVPCTTVEMERNEGLQRLAVRFPEIKFNGSWEGGASYDNRLNQALYFSNIGDLREAIRVNLVRIARMQAGVKTSDGEWSIPVAMMQVIGYLQPPANLADDVYLVRLAPKDGVMAWQFIGSYGQQVYLPATFTKAQNTMGMMRWERSFHTIEDCITFFPDTVMSAHTMQLADWPLAAKPTLRLLTHGEQHSTMWENERALISRLTQQYRDLPEVKLSATAFSYVLNLDSQRRYRMVFAGNENCGRQICHAYKQAKQGQAGSVILGILDSEMPLISPPAAAGIYLVTLVFPSDSRIPNIELTTPDKRKFTGWGGTTVMLPTTGFRESEPRAGYGYNTNTPPDYGNIELHLSAMSAQHDAFPFRIEVIGDPDDATTRLRKDKNGTSRGMSERVWTTGWISIKQP